VAREKHAKCVKKAWEGGFFQIGERRICEAGWGAEAAVAWMQLREKFIIKTIDPSDDFQ